DLAVLEPGVPVVVFLHIPLWSTFSERQGQAQANIANVVTNREAVYRLLDPFPSLVLSAHLQESTLWTRSRLVERNHGTRGAAGRTGPICYDGTPNGYGVYRVAGAQIRPHYQPTGREADHQLRIYPRGADPRSPDEVVANVWSWAPGWKVLWYENGVARGTMA